MVLLATGLAQDFWRPALGNEFKTSDTEFGRLHPCESIGAHDCDVAQFVDKPDRQLVADGAYASSSGILGPSLWNRTAVQNQAVN